MSNEENIKTISLMARGQTVSYEIVNKFLNVMPKKVLPKAEFYAFCEPQMPGFETTYSQVVRQIGLIYEDEKGNIHPRFTREISFSELFDYLQNCAELYYVPNPYTQLTKDIISLIERPIVLYSYVKENLTKIGINKSISEILSNAFPGITGNNSDKVITFFESFTDLCRDGKVKSWVKVKNENKNIPDKYKDPKAYFDYLTPLSQMHIDENIIVSESIKHSSDLQYFTALKTKPFLLLAGISGTGKSRLVRELAFATCPDKDDLRSNPTEPGNYCLIDMKPNWHDSSELLGYYSNISGKYDITPFMRFVYKASKHPNVPFFVCLDEMNLAPVEQYFAEFLSKLETRKIKDGVMQPVTLIDKDVFAKCELYKVRQSETDDAPQNRVNLYDQEGSIIMAYLKTYGLLLPYNLYVIGTVNMDDTTHQFSRKVIDRAFTIEMNGGKLEDMFNETDTLEYKDEPIPYEVVKANFTDAKSALDAMNRSPKTKGYADKIKSKVPEFLDAVNIALDATPFKVSYRVENELILYIASLIANDNSIDIDKAIATASLAILLEKVLPRVEGDDKLLTEPLNKLRSLLQEQFGGLAQDGSNDDSQKADLYQLVDNKLAEMQTKLRNSYFTSFFS